MIAVPQSFRDMPRWWADEAGRAWLDRLPHLVRARCDAWGLTVDGPVLHGSNALVVPVLRSPAIRNTEAAVLRLTPPGDDVDAEAAALTHWSRCAVVRLLDLDADAGAMLLERLDSSRSLLREPLHDAVIVLGSLARTLAIPAPTEARSTQEIAAASARTFSSDWSRLGRPTSTSQLDSAIDRAQALAGLDPPPLSVNGDLHFEQVMAGSRYPWMVVDPVLLRGDPEYDLGRVLWTRLGELERPADVYAAFHDFVTAAEVPDDRARDWVVVRAMSYLIWGLDVGLTWDPPKCQRLLDLFS